MFFRSLEPTPEESLVLDILDRGIRSPTTKSDAHNALSSQSEELVDRALSLASGYGIVKVLDAYDMRDPVFYSPLIWGDNIAKAGKALSHLPENRRAVLLQLIDSVRVYQGIPETAAEKWAGKNGEVGLVEFAVGLGLFDRTEILTKEGGATSFLTTPHLYGELAVAHGKDVCDRVRLFLDSIRHGQHYGNWVTGKIQDPATLLGKLVDAGEIGPCTAIGRDYVLVEKAGVVSVSPSRSRPGQFTMHLVQAERTGLPWTGQYGSEGSRRRFRPNSPIWCSTDATRARRASRRASASISSSSPDCPRWRMPSRLGGISGRDGRTCKPIRGSRTPPVGSSTGEFATGYPIGSEGPPISGGMPRPSHFPTVG